MRLALLSTVLLSSICLADEPGPAETLESFSWLSGKWARVRKTSDTIPYANGVWIFKSESELSLRWHSTLDFYAPDEYIVVDRVTPGKGDTWNAKIDGGLANQRRSGTYQVKQISGRLSISTGHAHRVDRLRLGCRSPASS